MADDSIGGSERILSIPTSPDEIPRIPGHPHPDQVHAEVRLPKPPREKPIITDREPRHRLNLPIVDERMVELRRRLGLTVPVVHEDGLTEIQLRKGSDGGYSFAVPSTYPIDGPLTRRVQARQFVRPSEAAGGEAWFFSLTIPQLDGSREVIRFPKVEGAENSLGTREAAALEALLNRPEGRGAQGLRRVIGAQLRRFAGPVAALIGAVALRGDSLPPIHVAAETFADPVGVVEPDRRAPYVEDVKVEEPAALEPVQQPAPVEAVQQSDPGDIPFGVLIEPGGSRWSAIEKHLAHTYALTGKKLTDLTALLVRRDRVRSGVDEEMAKHDQPGTPVHVPSPNDMKKILAAYDGVGGDAAAQALDEVIDPDNNPHDFAHPGPNAEAVQELERVLAELEAEPDDPAQAVASSTNPQ